MGKYSHSWHYITHSTSDTEPPYWLCAKCGKTTLDPPLDTDTTCPQRNLWR